MKRALVVGAGGLLGYTWSIAALARLERETGWDPRRAVHFVGTSAGSVIVTLLASGVSAQELLAGQVRAFSSAQKRGRSGKLARPPVPQPKPLSLSLALAAFRRRQLVPGLVGLLPAGTKDPIELAKPVEDAVRGAAEVDARVSVCAFDVESGERVVFGRHGVRADPLAAVCASCAVPGWYAPVVIDGRRCLDGGVASPTSADVVRAGEAEEVVIVSPLTSRAATAASAAEHLERLLRRAMTRVLDDEERRLVASGVRVVRIEPTAAELARLGPNFMDPRKRGIVLADVERAGHRADAV